MLTAARKPPTGAIAFRRISRIDAPVLPIQIECHWLTIVHFVTAITAKAGHSSYTPNRVHDRKGDPMTKIILTVVAALAVTVGALTITGAGDERSSTPTMLALPLLY